MQQLILIIHVLASISIVALVLLQHGKGADIGASFGSGSSQTVFGSQGHVPFLMKITAILAVIFFATNLGLAYLVKHNSSKHNLLFAPTQVKPKQIKIPVTSDKK